MSGSGGSFRKVLHERLATLREKNRKKTTGTIPLAPQKNGTATLENQLNYQLS